MVFLSDYKSRYTRRAPPKDVKIRNTNFEAQGSTFRVHGWFFCDPHIS